MSARSVMPLLLSLIHVTQDNMHRSWGDTVGDTGKTADAVGGSGGGEDGGGGRGIETGCGQAARWRHKDVWLTTQREMYAAFQKKKQKKKH